MHRPGRVIEVGRLSVGLMLPLVGVVAFGWRLRSLLVFYWIETGVAAARLSVEATFAGRPNSESSRIVTAAFGPLRHKRGALSTPGPLPPFRPQRLPSVLAAAGLLAVFWIVAGLFVIAIAEPVLVVRLAELSLGAAAIVTGQTATFVSNLGHRPYEQLSPHALIGRRRLAGQFLLLAVVFGGAVIANGSLAAAAGPVSFAVVVGRSSIDIADRFGLLERHLPPAFQRDTQVGNRSSVQTGASEPRNVWRASRTSVVVGRALASPSVTTLSETGLLVFVGGGLGGFAVAGTAGVGVVVVAGLLAGAVLIGVETDVRYGHLEYRLYDDCLVAHDRLFDAPQWRIELCAVTETTPSTAVLDRLPGLELERLFVRTDDESQRLVGLADAEGVRERIDEARSE